MTLRIRRGGGSGGAPPPPTSYGPSLGAASVRSGAGARTVSDPGGGISFNSSGSLQTAINNNATSSVFVCSVTNPTWNSAVTTGTKRPTIIFPGPVGQKVIEGGGQDSVCAINAGDGTTVRGGTFQNFGSTAGFGRAVLTQDAVLVEDVVATDCFTCGVDVQGLNSHISHCTLHTNGIQGLQTGNTGPGQTDGLQVEYCNIYGNNTRQVNPGGEGGAGKILFTGNGHYHHNYVHDNIGFGAWWDTDNWAWLIEENVCEDNYRSGMFYEANYGSVIRRNYIVNNGRDVQIGTDIATAVGLFNVRLSDSAAARTAPDGSVYPVDFQLNYVDHTGSFGGQTGGMLFLWDHTDDAGRHVANHDIHHNQFWIRFTNTMGGRVSRIRPVDEDSVAPLTTNFQLWNLDNNFFNNDYRVVNTTSNFWAWGSGTSIGADESFAAWQGHTSGETRTLI